MQNELSKDANQIINDSIQRFIASDQNQLLTFIGELMTRSNDLTMTSVVKRAYVQKNHARIREIKFQALADIEAETDAESKKLYSNETKRNAEAERRQSLNTEVIYLTKQIDLDDDEITRNDLLINNVNRLIQLGTYLLKNKTS